jgi:hypothetical protein
MREPVRVEGNITCWDVPGQLLKRGLDSDERLDVMVRAQGMILLVSAEQDGETKSATYYHDFFYKTVGALVRRASRLPIEERVRLGWGIGGDERVPFPVALCLSQVDRLDPARVEQAYGQGAEQLLLERLGEAPRQLFQWFRMSRCFAISSTGDQLRNQHGRVALIGDPQPRNVLAPLKWILGTWENR